MKIALLLFAFSLALGKPVQEERDTGEVWDKNWDDDEEDWKEDEREWDEDNSEVIAAPTFYSDDAQEHEEQKLEESSICCSLNLHYCCF